MSTNTQSSNVPCDGPECVLCQLTGPPDMVQVWVKDLDDGEWKSLTMKRARALELGLIKDATDA